MSTVNPREVIARSLGHMVDFRRVYGRSLHTEIAPWHCYTLDGGHSILVVLDDGHLGEHPSGKKLEEWLVPAPVKSVERAGWRLLDGFVVCELPYDPELGLMTPPGDDEYGDVEATQPGGADEGPRLRSVKDTAEEETGSGPFDPATVTAAAVERCQALVKEMRRHYPMALGQMTHFADQKGAPGTEDWPDWCWVPMAGAGAVVCPTGVMLPGDPRVEDMARVAALSTWWLTKGVYWIDDEAGAKHVGQAWSSPGVPAETLLRPDRILKGLPQQCVYIALPPHPPVEAGELPQLLGVFVHLEYDYRGGRPELRLLLDRDGTWDGLKGVPVLLDRPTLLASARELAKPEAFGGVQDEEQREILAQLVRLAPFVVWPAVEALLDRELVISGWDLPGEQPQPAEPRTTGVPRWRGAAKPTRWRVGITAPKPGLRSI